LLLAHIDAVGQRDRDHIPGGLCRVRFGVPLLSGGADTRALVWRRRPELLRC
jgi:hypothetical protein